MIYIRVDANITIATGHLMRCLSIADAFHKKKEQVTFITSDEFPAGIIQSKGYMVHVMDNDWNSKEDEIQDLISYLRKVNAEFLIVDSYQATEKYLSELRKVVKVGYIDDLNLFQPPVDIIINYSPCFREFRYYNMLNGRMTDEKGTYYLIGNEYIPLREEFTGITHKFKTPVTDIMITTGGTDPYNVTGHIIKRIFNSSHMIRNAADKPKESGLQNITYHVIVGKFNTYAEEILNYSKQYKNIKVYQNIKKMSDVMKICDIAISAGGTTIKELCACGVPTIAFAFADNQIGGLAMESKEGIVISAGDIRSDFEQSVSYIIDELADLACDDKRLTAYSVRMQKLVDGRGADRIAQKCLEIIG